MITIDPPLETLSPKEKLELLDRVWESIGPQRYEDVGIPEWHGAVVQERVAEAEQGKGTWLDLNEVRRNLDSKFQ